MLTLRGDFLIEGRGGEIYYNGIETELIVAGFILAISPLVLPQEPPSQTVFIELTRVGYWGSPAAEWIGQTISANTNV